VEVRGVEPLSAKSCNRLSFTRLVNFSNLTKYPVVGEGPLENLQPV